MDKRKRRRQRKNAFEQFMNIVKTIVLVVIAGAVIFFVIQFIGKSTGADLGEDSKISAFWSAIRSNDSDDASETETTQGGALELTSELSEGINTDEQGRTVYVKDGSIVKDCWVECEKSLYRLNADGFAVTGEYNEDAYIYKFSASGKLGGITRNKDYTDNASQETPGLVEKGGLKVFLDQNKGMGRFSSIKYKNGTASHYLGGEENMQYTLPGTVQIDDEGYIYWLPLVDGADEMEGRISGTLYRMKPTDEKRQIVAKGVTGYRVLTGENGSTMIYYSKNDGTLARCGSGNCRVDETVVNFTEDMEYEPVIKDDKIYLQTVDGYRVTKAFSAFTTGGFTYEIAADGEILSVAENRETELNGYIYSILSDEAFGRVRNVVTRKKADKTEMISNEFEGECHNLFANSADGKIYGEFIYLDGSPHLFVVTEDGDVDLLKDTDTGTESIELYGFKKGSAFVKNTYPDGTVKYQEISTSETSPIALGCEPVDITNQKPGSASDNQYEHLGPGYQEPSVGASPAGDTPGGPGALPTPTSPIPDSPVIVVR